MTLINRTFLKQQASEITIHQMLSFISVQELSVTIYHLDEYTKINIYLSEKCNHTVIVSREVHIIEDLKAKMLISIDILISESIIMNLRSVRKIAVIESCDNIEVFLTIIIKLINQISQIILVKITS